MIWLTLMACSGDPDPGSGPTDPAPDTHTDLPTTDSGDTGPTNIDPYVEDAVAQMLNAEVDLLLSSTTAARCSTSRTRSSPRHPGCLTP